MKRKKKKADLFTALVHPLRRRIQRTMMLEDAECSPRELATRFGESLSGLGYHVKVLEECGAMKLVRTRRVHGATQYFYRSSLKTEWAQLALKATTD